MKVFKKAESKTKTATAVAVRPTTTALALPEEWESKLALQAKDEAAVEQPGVQAFSLRAGVLSYNGQAMPDNKIRVIVLASSFERALFISKFDPNAITPPLCFALSEDGNEMAPHDGSYKKQSELCAICEHNVWGSDTNSPSGKGKACKETRRLACIPEDALTNGISKAAVAMLRVPVTSVIKWSHYVHEVSAVSKRPVWTIVTEISVEANPKTQFMVNFNAVDAINDVNQLRALEDSRTRAMQMIMSPYGTMSKEQYEDATTEKPKVAARRKF